MHDFSQVTGISETYHPEGILNDPSIIEMSMCARGVGCHTASLARASQEPSQGQGRF